MVVNNVAVASIGGTYLSLPGIVLVALTRGLEYVTTERERDQRDKVDVDR